MLRLALAFSAVAVAYDAIAAVIARSVGVSYDSFLVLALVIFFFMGILSGRLSRSWNGVLPIALAAIADATLGWYCAALIGPGYVPGWTPQTLVVMGAESALLATAIGAVGVWIGLAVAGARRLF